MIRGGLGFVDAKRMLLPQALLQPLNVGMGSVLHGIYYPQPSGRRNNLPDPTTPLLHDFMLTTIAPRFWRSSATFVINVKHSQGALKPILRHFKEHNVSILRAECSRAAHRYATWNVTVCFEQNMDEDRVRSAALSTGPRDNAYDNYEQVRSAALSLKQSLEKSKNLENSLFREHESGDPLLKESVVVVQPISTLPHFSKIAADADLLTGKHGKKLLAQPPFCYFQTQQLEVLRRLFQPFEIRMGPTYVDSQEMLNILEMGSQLATSDFVRAPKGQAGAGGFWNQSSLFPACVFAEVDTNQLTLRLAVLVPTQLERFFEVEFEYKKYVQAPTSKGLFSYILEHSPEAINIWRTYNQTTYDGELHETGLIRMILEHNEALPKEQKRLPYVKAAFEMLQGPCNDPELRHIVLERVAVNQINPVNVKDMLIETNEIATGYKYDVFVSYHSEDEEFADEVNSFLVNEGFSVFMSKQEIGTGEDFMPAIKQGLLKSREMCLIWNRRASSTSVRDAAREWVTTEWGIAWAMGRNIVPFLVYGKNEEDLPLRLRTIQNIKFSLGPKNFEKQMRQYVSDLKSRLRRQRRLWDEL